MSHLSINTCLDFRFDQGRDDFCRSFARLGYMKKRENLPVHKLSQIPISVFTQLNGRSRSRDHPIGKICFYTRLTRYDRPQTTQGPAKHNLFRFLDPSNEN